MFVRRKVAEGKLKKKKKLLQAHFDKCFNLNLFNPKKDSCKKCDILKSKSAIPTWPLKIKNETEQKIHLRKAELARECIKTTDTKHSKTNIGSPSYVCSMDLQKALPFPVLTVPDAYFKRNLCYYN